MRNFEMHGQSIDPDQSVIETGSVGQGGTPWPPPRQAWWAVFVFGITLTISYLDRGLLNLLVEPIKQDLALSDTQISLVMGFAFVAFYLVLGLPLAQLIDRGSRRLILGVCVVVWSLSTALCGTAQAFWQLALFRFGVGAGEAGVAPSMSSMLSDLFPPEKLPRAMSLMAFAFVCGNGLSLLLGGFIIGSLSQGGAIVLPLLGEVRPWQATFIMVGLPGLLAAALYVTVPEPVRRGRPAETLNEAASLREVLRYLSDNRRVFAPMFIGLALSSIAAAGAAGWTPAFFSRAHGWSPAQFGPAAGITSLVCMPVGLMLGFRVTEMFARQGRNDASLRLVAWAHWLALPFAVAMPLMPSPQLALVMFGLAMGISVSAIGSQNAALLIVTPNRMRAQMTALFLVMYNVIGFGLGPTVVATLTDFVLGSEAKLGLAMALTSAVLGTLGALSISLGLRPFGTEVERARRWA
ncbi:MFS transporter [Altererythrobacter sp.]|uniref:MFS transporter n=1 Tax=Altererythrobacter sp. TaxID=1872480 RepID=UPI003CFDBE84